MDFSFLNGYMDKTAGVEKLYESAFETSKILPDDYAFVEVGCWRGGSAVAIMQAIRDSGSHRWLYTVDPYGSKPFGLGDRVVVADHYHEEDYRHAMKFMADYAFEHNINHCHFRMTADDFMNVEYPFWYKGDELRVLDKIGFVYLDGEHTPDNVKREFEFFSLMLPVNGMVVTDDFPYWQCKHKVLDDLIENCPQDNFRVFYKKGEKC